MSSLLLVADYGASSGSDSDNEASTNSPARFVNIAGNYVSSVSQFYTISRLRLGQSRSL